jgi:DNA-binding NarL/FixJ family response regulator
MNILIVEDDLFKYSRIESVIRQVASSSVCTRIDNVHDTIRFIKKSTPDKLILDMSLPSHSANVGQGSPISMPTGGMEVILELSSISKLTIDTLILTQYPDIEIDFEYYSIEESERIIKEMFDFEKLSVAHYDEDSGEWENSVTRFLEV